MKNPVKCNSTERKGACLHVFWAQSLMLEPRMPFCEKITVWHAISALDLAKRKHIVRDLEQHLLKTI
jgi:hypothetical protein